LANALANLAAPSRLLSSRSDSAFDSVSPSLRELMLPAIQQLLQIVEDRLFPAGLQHTDSIRTPGHPAAEGSYVHPSQALAQSLDSLAPDARDSATRSVAKAAHAIEMAGNRGPRMADNPDPRTILALANQFIETGQTPNYLRAAELGRVVLSWYEGPFPRPVGPGTELAGRDRERHLRWRETLRKIWLRAPLLILLAGWLLSGAVAGLLLRALSVPASETTGAFNVWAIGFLALVVFQFVVAVRGALRPKSGGPPPSAP
jgi:hypothetical protein